MNNENFHSENPYLIVEKHFVWFCLFQRRFFMESFILTVSNRLVPIFSLKNGKNNHEIYDVVIFKI